MELEDQDALIRSLLYPNQCTLTRIYVRYIVFEHLPQDMVYPLLKLHQICILDMHLRYRQEYSYSRALAGRIKSTRLARICFLMI